jgi:hypothetical protein
MFEEYNDLVCFKISKLEEDLPKKFLNQFLIEKIIYKKNTYSKYKEFLKEKKNCNFLKLLKKIDKHNNEIEKQKLEIKDFCEEEENKKERPLGYGGRFFLGKEKGEEIHKTMEEINLILSKLKNDGLESLGGENTNKIIKNIADTSNQINLLIEKLNKRERVIVTELSTELKIILKDFIQESSTELNKILKENAGFIKRIESLNIKNVISAFAVVSVLYFLYQIIIYYYLSNIEKTTSKININKLFAGLGISILLPLLILFVSYIIPILNLGIKNFLFYNFLYFMYKKEINNTCNFILSFDFSIILIIFSTIICLRKNINFALIIFPIFPIASLWIINTFNNNNKLNINWYIGFIIISGISLIFKIYKFDYDTIIILNKECKNFNFYNINFNHLGYFIFRIFSLYIFPILILYPIQCSIFYKLGTKINNFYNEQTSKENEEKQNLKIFLKEGYTFLEYHDNYCQEEYKSIEESLLRRKEEIKDSKIFILKENKINKQTEFEERIEQEITKLTNKILNL